MYGSDALPIRLPSNEITSFEIPDTTLSGPIKVYQSQSDASASYSLPSVLCSLEQRVCMLECSLEIMKAQNKAHFDDMAAITTSIMRDADELVRTFETMTDS